MPENSMGRMTIFRIKWNGFMHILHVCPSHKAYLREISRRKRNNPVKMGNAIADRFPGEFTRTMSGNN